MDAYTQTRGISRREINHLKEKMERKKGGEYDRKRMGIR
jgi:hypothetical protein